MSQLESKDVEKSSADDRQSGASSSTSDGRQIPADLPYGEILRRVSSMSVYLPKPKKTARTIKPPIKPIETLKSENTIEKGTKILLQKVDTLVSVMERMSVGPISVDNYRYEAINKELQELDKMVTKKELSLEPLSNFYLKNVNKKLRAVELEIRDIYMSWIEYYFTILQEVFQQCLTLYKQVTMLKKKKKKDKVFLYHITEFSSYAAAQTTSLYKLKNTPYEPLPEVTTTDEIYERISRLETMADTPLPISFGNVPRASVGVCEKKKKKPSKKDKKEKKKMGSSEESKGISNDKPQVKFQEPEIPVQFVRCLCQHFPGPERSDNK